jgi:hypothetical protein
MVAGSLRARQGELPALIGALGGPRTEKHGNRFPECSGCQRTQAKRSQLDQ